MSYLGRNLIVFRANGPWCLVLSRVSRFSFISEQNFSTCYCLVEICCMDTRHFKSLDDDILLIRRIEDFRHLHKCHLFICTFYPFYPAFMCWWESLDIQIVCVPKQNFLHTLFSHKIKPRRQTLKTLWRLVEI